MADTVTIVSGNLFALAATAYADPNQWIRVMSVNGLTDPFVVSNTPMTLILPAPDPTSSGVPNAGTSIPMNLGGVKLGTYDNAIYDESLYT